MSDNDSQYTYEEDDHTNGSQDDRSTGRGQPPQSCNENTQLAFYMRLLTWLDLFERANHVNQKTMPIQSYGD